MNLKKLRKNNFVPTIAKPCLFAGSCPGDLGNTEVLWFGRQLCVSKASGIIKVFAVSTSPRDKTDTTTQVFASCERP
jgi:cob(I)alamin adenosyltransferase